MKTRSSSRVSDDSSKREEEEEKGDEQQCIPKFTLPEPVVDAPVLLDIGPLVLGTMVCRPPPKPATRSPYIAQVELAETGEKIQAWAPAMDVGGLCIPGSKIWLSENEKAGKHSTHKIELVEVCEPETGNEVVLVGVNPNLAEKIAFEVFRKGLLEEEIGFGMSTPQQKSPTKSPKKKKSRLSKGSDGEGEVTDEEILRGNILRRQRDYNDSRIDVELTKYDEGIEIERCLVEIKNVVCADYCSDTSTKLRVDKKYKSYVYESDSPPSEYMRSGLFPIGKSNQEVDGKKVVSERAIKHVRNLAKLVANNSQEKPSSPKTNCVILFVLNRADCYSMRPCEEACGIFAEEVRKANQAGVSALCVRVRWTSEGKAFYDGVVTVNL